MASLACSISSLKPQPINPSSHKLLGFNYLLTQSTHQPSFYSTTRSSNYFTSARCCLPANPNSSNYVPKQSDHKDENIFNTSSEEDNIVNRPCVYAIKLEEPGGTADSGLWQKLVNSMKKNHVSFSNSITTGLCMLKKKNDAQYNFHFGEHDYVSVQGQFLNSEDKYLNVIGGSGIFKGVQGKVKLQKICNEGPVKLFYTFYLEGIENLPDKL